MATQINETSDILGADGSLNGDLPASSDQSSSALATKATQATTILSGKISEVAGKLRDKIPTDGRLGSAAGSLRTGFERSSTYLRGTDLRTVGTDLTGVVRRYPMQSSLVGLGLGILLGRALVNRNSVRV